MKLRFLLLVTVFLAAICLTVFSPTQATAEPTFFAQYCAGCHTNDSATCNGCHAHGVWQSSSRQVMNLTATTDLDQYQPGQTVTVTFSGGYRHGWIRAILYDHNSQEVDRITGPTGMGDDGTGSSDLEFPVLLSAAAPSTPGFYTWSVSWFGSPFDTNNSNVYPHVQENVPTNEFEVLPVSCNDADGDGYEDAACNPDPANGGGDCDDTDASVNPGMTEVCDDGIDNDCDGLVDANDPDCGTALTQITLNSPQNLANVSSPPTFSWTPDGGTNCVFAVDLALSPTGPIYSTYENMHQPIHVTTWTMPASIWNKIPSGKRVYWRVRGADMDVVPRNIITSNSVRSFYKQ